ncbi:hypothetical protein [Amorphus sp. MBR-141]
MQELVDEIDRRSANTEFGRLQDLRKELKGLGRRPNAVPFGRANSDEWAHHHGGFDELQFNLGEEAPFVEKLGDLRYGIAFSFQPNRSLLDVSILKPKAALFNDFLRQNREELSDLWMWYHTNDGRSSPHRPTEILNEHMTPGTFVFIGQVTTFNDPDYDRMIATFNRLLPIYLYVQGGRATVSAPSKFTFDFKPGFSLGMTETAFQASAKSSSMHFRHKLIQKALFDLLVAEHGKHHVGGEQQSDGGGLIDMVVQTPKKRILFEVKTASTARGCIREALGQILDYALWPESRSVDEVVIVGEVEATDTEKKYVDLLAKSLPIPISYRSICLVNSSSGHFDSRQCGRTARGRQTLSER